MGPPSKICPAGCRCLWEISKLGPQWIAVQGACSLVSKHKIGLLLILPTMFLEEI